MCRGSTKGFECEVMKHPKTCVFEKGRDPNNFFVKRLRSKVAEFAPSGAQ